VADGFRHSGGHVTPECLSFFMGDGNAYLDCVLQRRGMHRTRTPISNAPVATEVGRNPSTAPKVDGLAPHRLVEKDVCEAFGNAAGSHGWNDRRHQSSVRFERPRPLPSSPFLATSPELPQHPRFPHTVRGCRRGLPAFADPQIISQKIQHGPFFLSSLHNRSGHARPLRISTRPPVCDGTTA
jgi:hypothetical protein